MTESSEPRSSGGYIPGTGTPVDVSVKYIREVEPGLHVVSINGDKPEYLFSAARLRANPEFGRMALDAINNDRQS